MENPQGREQQPTCEAAKQMILTRDFRLWRGMPEGCAWPGADEQRPEDPREWWARPLRSKQEGTWTHSSELQGYSKSAFTYLRRDMILFDGQNPEMPCTGSELVKALGEPAAKLDWDAGTLPLPGMEWVWPERGIALYLGGDPDHVAHVALFASTTLEDYQQGHLRLQEKKALRPMKGK